MTSVAKKTWAEAIEEQLRLIAWAQSCIDEHQKSGEESAVKSYEKMRRDLVQELNEMLERQYRRFPKFQLAEAA